MSNVHSENMIMGGKTVVKLEEGTDSIKIPKTKNHVNNDKTNKTTDTVTRNIKKKAYCISDT
jgi:hypothetical protein